MCGTVKFQPVWRSDSCLFLGIFSCQLICVSHLSYCTQRVHDFSRFCYMARQQINTKIQNSHFDCLYYYFVGFIGIGKKSYNTLLSFYMCTVNTTVLFPCNAAVLDILHVLMSLYTLESQTAPINYITYNIWSNRHTVCVSVSKCFVLVSV